MTPADIPAPRINPTPQIILVRPQMGENIGAAARGMLNFSLEAMRIVAPRDGWPNPAANAMASGAGRVLSAARLFDDTRAAIGDLDYVYATTARMREYDKPLLSPSEAMADAHARIAQGQEVGVLFGPERTGLQTEDILPAQALVTVPVNPEFPSLNLAQCVLILGYEWARQGGADMPAPKHESEPATRLEVTKLLERLTTRLDDARFFWPEAKAEPMRRTLENLFYRLDLSSADIRILHGVFRTLGRDKSDDEPS